MLNLFKLVVSLVAFIMAVVWLVFPFFVLRYLKSIDATMKDNLSELRRR